MPGPFPVPAPVAAVCAFDELEMRKLFNYDLICTKVGQGLRVGFHRGSELIRQKVQNPRWRVARSFCRSKGVGDPRGAASIHLSKLSSPVFLSGKIGGGGAIQGPIAPCI